MLSKRQIQILELVEKQTLTIGEICDKLGIEPERYVRLVENGLYEYVRCHSASHPFENSVIGIEPAGEALLQYRRENRIKSWLPMIFSLIALFCSILGWFLPVQK